MMVALPHTPDLTEHYDLGGFDEPLAKTTHETDYPQTDDLWLGLLAPHTAHDARLALANLAGSSCAARIDVADTPPTSAPLDSALGGARDLSSQQFEPPTRARRSAAERSAWQLHCDLLAQQPRLPLRAPALPSDGLRRSLRIAVQRELAASSVPQPLAAPQPRPLALPHLQPLAVPQTRRAGLRPRPTTRAASSNSPLGAPAEDCI